MATNTRLFTILIAYTLIGGLLFLYVEQTNEKSLALNVQKTRLNFLNAIKLKNSTEELLEIIKKYEKKLEAAISAGYTITDEDEWAASHSKWDFWGSVFYCFTVYTTIGYGNFYPRTQLGQTMSVLYGFVGIPLCLVVLARIGDTFNRSLKACWRRLCTEKRSNSSIISIYFHSDNTFDYPLPLAIAICVIYIMFGGLLYSYWEQWDFNKACYFTFVSLSTIGFGDVLPKDNQFFILSSCYVFLGLAIMSMILTRIMEMMQEHFDRPEEPQTPFTTKKSEENEKVK